MGVIYRRIVLAVLTAALFWTAAAPALLEWSRPIIGDGFEMSVPLPGELIVRIHIGTVPEASPPAPVPPPPCAVTRAGGPR